MILFRWLIGLLAALVLALFSIANRHVVEIRFSPLPYEFELPLYLLLLAALFTGFVVGYVVMQLARLKLPRFRGRSSARRGWPYSRLEKD